MSMQTFLGSAFIVAVGYVATIPLEIDPLPIEIKSVTVSDDLSTAVIDRKVNVNFTVRADYLGEVVNIKTEQGVPECERKMRVDFSTGEPTTQTFDFHRWTMPECRAALVDGERYQLVVTVTPPDGEPTVARSNIFSP